MLPNSNNNLGVPLLLCRSFFKNWVMALFSIVLLFDILELAWPGFGNFLITFDWIARFPIHFSLESAVSLWDARSCVRGLSSNSFLKPSVFVFQTMQFERFLLYCSLKGYLFSLFTTQSSESWNYTWCIVENFPTPCFHLFLNSIDPDQK